MDKNFVFFKTKPNNQEHAYFFKINQTDFLCIHIDSNLNKEKNPVKVGEIYKLSKSDLDVTNFDVNKSSLPQNLLNLILNNYTHKQSRFMDQIDGNNFAEDFVFFIVNSLKDKLPLLSIERHNLAISSQIVDGLIITVFNGDQIIATSNIMRTPMNYTHVVCGYYPENIYYPD